jgi:hypothetical protein
MPDELLAGTPYVLDSVEAISRFDAISRRCAESATIAERAQMRIKSRAGNLFGEFSSVQRSEMVAESNRIEGYNWSTETVKAAADLYKELLSLPLRAFTDGVRNDFRVYEALGLYKAHQLAEEWAEDRVIPSEMDVRALHSLIAIGENYAGRYKAVENSIHGSSLRTSLPIDVSRHMRELSLWWRDSAAPPVLQATIIHSWLTQIHPFEDGNGRMARLLANIALSQHGYPPLLLRSESDRGQYLDALARSDDGDILPLYELFSQVIRRQVRVMARHEYVAEMVEQRLLSDFRARFDVWRGAVGGFTSAFSDVCENNSWAFRFDGIVDLASFHLLSHEDPGGNSWYIRCGPRHDPIAFLLWWGYQSYEMTEALGAASRKYPSVFVSRRVQGGDYPYARTDEMHEMQILPMTNSPIQILSRSSFLDFDYSSGAEEIFSSIRALV